MNDKTKVIGTPYDDGFRTIIEKCPRLLIPIVNEMFGTTYGMDAEVVSLSNEFFMTGSTGESKKIITDTYVHINGVPYHIECQSSNDSTMIIRMFEYDVQIGISEAGGKVVNGNEYHIRFPDSGVMYLRTTAENLTVHKIVLETPGGTVSYEVPTLKVTMYDLDEIFEKNLLFLIPFFLFSLESELAVINENEEKLQHLTGIYNDIYDRLLVMNEEKRITNFEVAIICGVTVRIAQSLALKEKNIQERIGEIMGGKILDLEAIKIFDEGIDKGAENQQTNDFLEMVKDGIPLMKAKKYTKMSDERLEQLKKKYNL